MALIRGFNSKRPCPICLIKLEDLSNLLDESPMRTTDRFKTILVNARLERYVKDRKEILKEEGLRNIDVFLFINYHKPLLQLI